MAPEGVIRNSPNVRNAERGRGQDTETDHSPASIIADISSGLSSFVSPRQSTTILGSPCEPPSTIRNGKDFASTAVTGSEKDRPMMRFTSYTVLRGLLATWLLAAEPTSFPSAVKETHDGMVRPDGDSMTSTFWVLGSKQATQE